MKKISLLLFSILLFSCCLVSAQGEMDAYKLSRNAQTGTARSMSMGGAFGALGGDISGIAINPAGIGVYNESEIVTTLNIQSTSNKSTIGSSVVQSKETKSHFDNLGFVASFGLESDIMPRINIGFTYNRLKTFDRQVKMHGNNLKNSMSNYIAGFTNNYNRNNPGNQMTGDNLLLTDDNAFSVWDNGDADWRSVLAYNSGIMVPTKNGTNFKSSFANKATGALPTNMNNDFSLRERGYTDSYDFNIGTNINDFICLGLTLSLTDINYNLYSDYSENIQDNGYMGGYSLENWLRSDGNGAQLKLGVIVKPIQALRIGLSYQSPTWYRMSDYYAANMNSNLGGLYKDPNIWASTVEQQYQSPQNIQSYNGDQDGRTDYTFHTPDRWTLSVAGVISNKAIISADYELTNYCNMSLAQANNGNEYGDNEYIKEDFRRASSIRLGVEYRLTPQFSVRAGYNWIQSPVKSSVKSDPSHIATAGTDTHYMLDGAMNTYSVGLGYRFNKHFYFDFAYVMKTQASDLYTYASADKTSLETKISQGLFTLGYKF